MVKGPRTAVLGLLMALVLTGCSNDSSSSDASSSPSSPSSTSTAAPEAEITVDPAGGAAEVMPDETVTVQVVRRDLSDVTVIGAGGDEIEGQAREPT